MKDDLPHDADGDTLRRFLETGSDLTKEMEIDFAVKVGTRDIGLKFAAVVEPLGFRTSVTEDEENHDWTCYCSVSIIPSYDEIVRVQDKLELIGRPFDAVPDGWSSLGNLPHDEDGDTLRLLVEIGSDLTKEVEIDFAVKVATRDMGLKFAAVVEPLGFRTSVVEDDETHNWTCYCSVTMIPSYDEIVGVQEKLASIGQPFNAVPDGWGSRGNAIGV